jgi:hypothetical protein
MGNFSERKKPHQAVTATEEISACPHSGRVLHAPTYPVIACPLPAAIRRPKGSSIPAFLTLLQQPS